MKTKVKRMSKRTLALLLGVLMLVTSIGVGSILTANAYNSFTIYYTTSSSGAWSSAPYASISLSSNSGSTSISLSANTTYRFVITAGSSNANWWGNNSFDLSSTTSQTKTLGNYYNFTASSSQISSNPNTLKTSTAGSYTFNASSDGTNLSLTVSGGSGSSSSNCSTNKTYRVVGTANIAGTAWSNTAVANNMTYSSTLKCYTKTYSNVAAGTMDFRIIEGSTWSQDWGFSRANKVDASGIVSSFIVKPGSDSDNNIRMTTTQKANIEIRLDDSKSDTSAITVIVTPAVSTVTAETPTGGTITVNGGTSASNIAYGGSVNLVATAATNYHFGSWTANNYLTYTNASSATTTATVTGTTTVNATFIADSFSVTKASEAGYTITKPTAGSAQHGTSVSVSATAADGYYIDGLYYKEQGSDTPHTIFGNSTHTTNTSLTDKIFTMPTSNVTIYAWVHEKASSTVTYGVCTGQSSYGYVSVGEQYSTEASTMKHTIDSGTKVLEGTKVNFCARPASGYYFVGWYSDAGGTNAISGMTNQDATVTSPSGNYYAKFASLSASSGVRLLIKSDANATMHFWNVSSATGNISDTNWDNRPKISSYEIVKIDGSTYYMMNTSDTSFNFLVRNSGGSAQTPDQTISAAGTYVYDYDNSSTLTAKTKWTSFNWYFPIKYYVTNPDKGASTVRAPQFGQAGANVTFYHSPSDTSNWKTSRTTTSFSANLTNSKTTGGTTSRTMPSTYSSTPTFTATFVEKEYYKVTFSAGKGGTVTATAGGTAIKSGTMVQEGKSVVITATPSSGYSVAGWTASGDITGTSTGASRSFTLTKETTAKVYFTKSKGTSSTATYLGYAKNDTNPVNWTNFVETYVWNGRVYGYIENNTNQTTYDFQAYDAKPSNNTEKYTKQYYHDNNAVWADTEFTDDITFESGNARRHEYTTTNDGKCYFIQFTASAKVKAIMIDLGPVESSTSNKARPDKDNNTYHIIPIYNTDISKVTVYAKDGTYRDDSDYDYMPTIADTVITTGTYVTNRSQQSEFETAVATKGKSITVKTTINSGAYNRDRFYVKGFSFNGITPELLTENSTGVYTCTYTIPEDFDYDYLEITPIYFIKDSYLNTASNNASATMFYIENYDEDLQNTGWGNTLAVYPFYSTTSSPVYSKANVFGGYPGLPVINYGGRRFVQVPTKYKIAVDNENGSAYSVGTAATIKGITLSNYYWDKVHRDFVREVDTHLQTYDFDDFYKIYRETSDGKEVNQTEGDTVRNKVADQITFAFKYRTSYDNFGATKRYSAGDTIPNTITKSSFTNGWEPLLDYHDRPINIFGKQLTTTEQNNDPILVVSNGYEYTHAGYYATTWTAYYNNNGTYTKIGTITPSALIISSKDRMINNELYPDGVSLGNDYPTMMQLDDNNSQTVYETLKTSYADRPVQITYEKAILNSNSSGTGKYYHSKLGELSTRSDGRWYYSYEGELINANLRIDYSNDGGETYYSDTFKSGTNKGEVTGATVKFKNTLIDDLEEDTDDNIKYALNNYHDTVDYNEDNPENKIVSNQNDYYNFEATQGSGYIFAGWGMERDGITTWVNADDVAKLTGKSQMTSNATFVARYIKNPAGHLTLNHSVASNSEGDATTYVGVKAINKSTNVETWLTAPSGDHYVEESYSIDDSTYSSYNSGYKFKIYLKTVPNDFSSFNRFSAKDGESQNYFSTEHQETVNNVTTTYFEIDVDDLFELNNSSIPEQQFDTLTYYSHLSSKTFNYNFNYTYPAYVSTKGNQSYRVTGTFTYDELNENMRMNGSNLVFKDDDAKTAVLNKLAPYEKNFKTDISWNTSVSTSFDTGNNTISAEVQAITNSDFKINVTFKFNYSTDSNYQPVSNATYSSEAITVTVADSERPNHMTLFKKNSKFVTAPRSLMDGNTEMVFRYWSVKTPGTSKRSEAEYSRCYDDEFNFALFQDSVIESVYTEKDTSEGVRDGYDPDAQELKDLENGENGVKISFMENSRNQYNDNQSGNEKNIDRKAMGDRMYTDFLLNFNNIAGNTVLKELGTDKKRAGLIIEVVGNLDYVDGKYVTKTEDEYRTQYGANITQIGEMLSGKDTTINQLTRLENYITGTTNANPIRGAKSEFDVTELDNKNRLQYAYSMVNRSHRDLSVGNNRYNVYRAYAYIADVTKSGSSYNYSNIKISAEPVYFTIYDMASIQNYAEAQASGGIQ